MDDDDPLDETFTHLLGASTTSIADEDATYGRIVERAHRRIARRRLAASVLVIALVGGVAFAAATNRPDRAVEVQTTNTDSSSTTTTQPRPCGTSGTAPNGQTYGTMPTFPRGQAIPPEQALAGAPDYIAVAAAPNGGVAGYVKAADVYSIPAKIQTVYACDLTTVVGHMVPDHGFVPLGAKPAPAP